MSFFQPGQQAYCQSVGTSKTANNVIFQRSPTTSDTNYPIGTFWQNQTAGSLYILNSFNSSGGTLQAIWLLVSVTNELNSLTGSASPLSPVYPTSSSATPPDNIQLTNLDGSMTITSDPSNNRVIFTANTLSITWGIQSVNFNVPANSANFIASGLIGTLASSPTNGNTVEFIVDTSGTFQIQAAAGQYIRIGNKLSSSGGTATNTSQGDAIVLVYSSTSGNWISESSTGNWILA